MLELHQHQPSRIHPDSKWKFDLPQPKQEIMQEVKREIKDDIGMSIKVTGDSIEDFINSMTTKATDSHHLRDLRIGLIGFDTLHLLATTGKGNRSRLALASGADSKITAVTSIVVRTSIGVRDRARSPDHHHHLQAHLLGRRSGLRHSRRMKLS